MSIGLVTEDETINTMTNQQECSNNILLKLTVNESVINVT